MPGNMPDAIRALMEKQSSTALSEAESQQLDEWYESLEYVPAVNLLDGGDREAAEKEGIWMELNQRIRQEPATRVYRLKPWMAKAAAVAMLAGLGAGWFWYQDTKKPYHLEVATHAGKVHHVTLPDGSQVWLNAQSNLQYNKWEEGKPREVMLNGEAFFDIAQQANRPFIIHTKAVDIQVLGTSFNVKAYNEDSQTETTLVTGKVQIVMKQEDGRTVELSPNQKLIVQNIPELKKVETINSNNIKIADSVSYHIDEVKKITGDSTIAEISWKERKLTFFDEPLSEVALRLQRWYGVNVIITDETMKNARFTGTFRDESLQKVMEVLRMSAPFNYHISNDTLMINK